MYYRTKLLYSTTIYNINLNMLASEIIMETDKSLCARVGMFV